jgi:hypothetical protein
MSIRARITLLGLGLVTVVICCLSASLFALISQGLDSDHDEELAKRADASVASIATAPADSFTPRPSPLAPIDPTSSVDIFTTVLAADGTVLWTTGVPLAVPPEALAAAQRDGRAWGSVPLTDKEGVRVQVRPWSRADLGLSGYVVVGQSTRRTQQDRSRSWRRQ